MTMDNQDLPDKPDAQTGFAPSSGSAIAVYPRYPDEEIRRCIEEIREQLPAWFDANPQRKICKVNLFYGRSVDLRRENYERRLDEETNKLLSQPNAKSRGGE